MSTLKKITREELDDILNKHGRWLADKKPEKRAYLSYRDLCGFSLEGANLQEINFEGANLAGVNLRGADLREVNFREANLTGAKLQGADLTDANLYRANLTEVNFKDVKVEGANFYAATLSDTSFEGAIFIDGWKITRDAKGHNYE